MNNLAINQLSEIAKLFLKLGTLGFGGPAAHIAMMEDEVVSQKTTVVNARAVFRFIRRNKPNSRAKFHRNGDSYRLFVRGMAGVNYCRCLFYSPSSYHHRWLCLDLCNIGKITPSFSFLIWH